MPFSSVHIPSLDVCAAEDIGLKSERNPGMADDLRERVQKPLNMFSQVREWLHHCNISSFDNMLSFGLS